MDTRASEFLTAEELAREVRASKASVYRAIHNGELAAVRLGENGALRISRGAVNDWLTPVRGAERRA